MGAIADVLIPADDFPGGQDAGVVHYIDRQLTRKYKRHQTMYRDFLSTLDRDASARYGKPFVGLSVPQQTAMLMEREQGADKSKFDLVLAHTMQGYYGSPRHGGNNNAGSWQMLGVPTVPIRGRLQYTLPPAPAAKAKES